MSLSQSFQQKLLQKLSPQQIQLMKLLQVPTANLEERIQSELEENPALEMAEGEKEIEFGEEVDNEFDAEIPEDEPAPLDEYEPSDDTDFIVDDDGEIADYKLKDDNYPEMDDNAVIPIKIETSFHELLTDQLGMLELDEREYTIAEQVLGSLDDDGYLRRALSSIADDLAFRQGIEVSEKEIEKIVLRIQDFDPAGIGARDLQECLLLQLKRKNRKANRYNWPLQFLQNTLKSLQKSTTKKFNVNWI